MTKKTASNLSLDRQRSVNEGVASGSYGELSEDLVKAATGQFDVAIVTKFSWCKKALQARSHDC